MALVEYIACDKCGCTLRVWINQLYSMHIAVSIARDYGWQVGKTGWYCPDCRTRRKKNDKRIYSQHTMRNVHG